MKKLEIMSILNRKFNRAGLQLKKHSPEILVVAGVVGTVASTVMACKATTKLSDVLEESKVQIDQVKYYADHTDAPELLGKYTEEDGKKDLAISYAQAGLKVAKLYAPAVILGIMSIAAILGGHNILRKRNIAIAAAYAGLDKSFKEYRGRVVERFGEALDKELRYNIKAKEIEETVVNEDGTEATVTKTVNVAECDKNSDYAKFFDEYNPGWSKDPEANLMFLRRQQDYANELLKRKGHMFLNEIYDMLGIPRTKAGQVVGWIYDEKCPIGDNYIDFGIYDVYSSNEKQNERRRAFVNGHERSILLDFNVDGNILDMI